MKNCSQSILKIYIINIKRNYHGKIIGLINAPFTPFYENGEVNYRTNWKRMLRC